MQLLEHFKELTLHPKNTEELKGLILELALRGKLTSNLSRIGIKEDVVSGYYDLPENWYWDKFQNLCDFQMGKTPPSKESQYWDGGIPWISIADMTTYQKIYDTKKTISDLGLKNYFRGTLAKKGTLIMSFKLTIGKTSILGIDACHNEAIISIYPKKQILQEFLFLFLPVISNWGTQVSALMGNTLNKEKLQNLKVPIPPLDEQKAIVEVVNQLFAEVEQLEALTKERIQLKEDFVTSALNQLTQAAESDVASYWELVKSQFGTFFTEKSSIKKLREAILQLAVQGKLTHHWRSLRQAQGSPREPVSVLLEKIKAEKDKLVKAGKIKKEKPLPPITEDEIPYDLPEGWVWCRLSQITELITKGSSPNWQGVQYVEEGKGILFVTSENVGSYELIWKNKKYVETKFNEIEPRSILKKNDLLMNIVGGSIGRTAIYNIDDLANINQAVTIIRLIPLNSYEYMLHFFNSPTCISYMFDKQVDNARPNLSMGNISNFLIPLPSLEEQKAIVEKVNGLMALCDQLE